MLSRVRLFAPPWNSPGRGEVDFPALCEVIDVRRPPWPREGMIMHTLTVLSTLWGDPSPWALALEKNLNITCKENFPYHGGV